MPKPGEKEADKKDGVPWYNSAGTLLSYFFSSGGDVSTQGVVASTQHAASAAEFKALQVSARELKAFLGNLYPPYKLIENTLAKACTFGGLFRRVPGFNYTADRNHLINFIESVNCQLQTDFAFADKKTQILHYRAMQGLACYGVRYIESQYTNGTSPDGGKWTGGSALYKLLKLKVYGLPLDVPGLEPEVLSRLNPKRIVGLKPTIQDKLTPEVLARLKPEESRLTNEDMAIALVSLKTVMMSYGESCFTYEPGKSRADYIQFINQQVHQLSPDIEQVFSASLLT